MILMGTDSSRKPGLTLVHPLVAWKALTLFALKAQCFTGALQTAPSCGAAPSYLWAADGVTAQQKTVLLKAPVQELIWVIFFLKMHR